MLTSPATFGRAIASIGRGGAAAAGDAIDTLLSPLSQYEVLLVNDLTTQPNGINDASLIWPRTRAQFDYDTAFASDVSVENINTTSNYKITMDYAGAWWDTRRLRLGIWNGGHASTVDNSPKYFDFADLIWHEGVANGPGRLAAFATGADPSYPFTLGGTPDYWPYPNAAGEISPYTMHSYGMIEFIEGASAASDQILVAGAGGYSVAAQGGPGGIWNLDPTTDADPWSAWAADAGNPHGGQFIHDGDNTIFWIANGNFGRRIEIDTATIHTLSTFAMSNAGSIPDIPSIVAPDPATGLTCSLRYTYSNSMIRHRRIFADTGTTVTNSDSVATSGNDPVFYGAAGATGVVTNDAGTTAYFWYGDEYLYPFDTQTFTWGTPLTFTGYSGGSVPARVASQYIWGKLRFLTGKNAILGCNGTNGLVYLFKL